MTLRDAICKWLTANNIPYNRVPISEVPAIRNGCIYTIVQKHNPEGKPYLNDAGRVATEVLTVPPRQHPPETLQAWLAGKVPTGNIFEEVDGE